MLLKKKKKSYNASLQQCSVGKFFLDKKVWPITVYREEKQPNPFLPPIFQPFKGQYSMSLYNFTLNSVLDIHFGRSKSKNWFNTTLLSQLFSVLKLKWKLNLVIDCKLDIKERWNTRFFNNLEYFSNLRHGYNWLRKWTPNYRYTLGMLGIPQTLMFARSCFASLHFYLMLLQILIKTFKL